jgi:hypothetical protein
VVADSENERVGLFRVEDGTFVRHVATELDGPTDVEECEGGWVVVCMASSTMGFVSSDHGSEGGIRHVTSWDPKLRNPSALALVPGLGLVVRSIPHARLHFFATPDVVAMSAMSATRVAWLVGVVRGVQHWQEGGEQQHPGQWRRR